MQPTVLTKIEASASDKTAGADLVFGAAQKKTWASFRNLNIHIYIFFIHTDRYIYIYLLVYIIDVYVCVYDELSCD